MIEKDASEVPSGTTVIIGLRVTTMVRTTNLGKPTRK